MSDQSPRFKPIQEAAELNQAIKDANKCGDPSTQVQERSINFKAKVGGGFGLESDGGSIKHKSDHEMSDGVFTDKEALGVENEKTLNGFRVNPKLGAEVEVTIPRPNEINTKIDCELTDGVNVKAKMTENTNYGIDKAKEIMALEHAKESLIHRYEHHGPEAFYSDNEGWPTDTKFTALNPDGSPFKPEFDANGKLTNADSMCVGQQTVVFGDSAIETPVSRTTKYCEPGQGMPQPKGQVFGDASSVTEKSEQVAAANTTYKTPTDRINALFDEVAEEEVKRQNEMSHDVAMKKDDDFGIG